MNYSTHCPFTKVHSSSEEPGYCLQAECELWDSDMDCCCFKAIAINLDVVKHMWEDAQK